jgi:hypothetical protein
MKIRVEEQRALCMRAAVNWIAGVSEEYGDGIQSNNRITYIAASWRKRSPVSQSGAAKESLMQIQCG